MPDYGADELTREETLEGTWSYNGNEYDLLVRDISKRDLDVLQQYQRVALNALDGNVTADDIEALPDFSFEDEEFEDRDFMVELLDEKLIKPDVDLDDTRTHKVRALFEGMVATWQNPSDVQEAREAMAVEGNGSPSPSEHSKR